MPTPRVSHATPFHAILPRAVLALGTAAYFAAWASIFAAGASLFAACASTYGFTAEVELQGPVGGTCMMGALDSQPDVVDLIRTGDNAVSFRISLPGVEKRHWPDYALVEEEDLDGNPSLTLSTDYETSLLEHDALAQQTRARELVAQVTDACTGHRPTLGATVSCGRGEGDDLCARGR